MKSTPKKQFKKTKMPGGKPEQSNNGSINWSFFDSKLQNKVSQDKDPVVRILLWLKLVFKPITGTGRFVGEWLKANEPRWRTILAMIVLVAILSTMFFVSSSLTQAASYTFVQTDWSGGVSGSSSSHPGNQTGWTNFSAQTNADTGTAGSVKTSSYTNSDYTETFTATTYRDDANSTIGSTFALVSNVKGHSAIDSDSFTTSSINTTGANLLVMVASSAITSITPSDSKSNTWTQAVRASYAQVSTIYYAWNPTVGTNHTFTLSGTDIFGNIQVYAFSGAQTSSNPLDQTNENETTSSTTGQPGSVTPTTDNQLLITGNNYDFANDLSINSSFTSPAGAGVGYGDPKGDFGFAGGQSAYLIQSTAASVNPTWTHASSINHYVTIATFKSNPSVWGTSGQLAGAGTAQSLTVDSTSENIRAATLTKNDTVGTGSITYYLSNDGSTFNQVTAGSQYTFSASGSDLRFKVVLTGNATVQDLSISYTGYYGTSDLTSSAYNTGDNTNLITKLAWTPTTPAGTTIKFQIRSAPDSSGSPGTWSNWCGYSDCTGSTYFESGDNNVTLGGAHTLRSGANDRWFQYKVFFTSNGLATATLDDATITYVVNAPPNFDADYPTAAAGGASASQVTNSASADFGKVLINYRIRDTDTTSGTSTPGFITPSFEYNIGAGWVAITSGNLGGSDLNNKAVDVSSYTTYTATWDAQAQIPTNYLTTAQVRVTINDNEAANATAQTTTANFTLDTKVPVVSVFTANSATDAITLTANDDTALEYRISNNSDYSADGVNASSGSWQSAGGNSISITPSWTFAGSPNEQVYYQVRDVAGNTTSGSAKIPVTLTDLDIKDISNEDAENFREFVSWGVYSSAAGATFASYKVYRSTDGSSFSLVSTINDININYYADFGLNTSNTYYYKVVVFDSDGDTSNYSSTVSDQPNGQGGSDTTGPTITSVTVAETQATYVRITWTTDELSDSRVDYSISPSTAFGSGQTNSSFVTSHSITLTGLTPNTTYLFRARSLDVLGNTGTNDNSGAGFSFTTSSGPIISGVTETLVNENSATIFWNTNVDSGSFVTYSTNADLSSSTRVGSATLVGGTNPFQHTVNLSSLTTGTTYYYFVESTDGSSNTSFDKNGGNYYSFRTTTDTVAPVISNIQTPVTAPTAGVIVWQTNELATTQLNWGATSGNLNNTTTLDSTLSIFHVVSLTGLAEETEYFFRARSKDQAGNETTADEDSFETGSTTVITVAGGGGGGGSSVVLDTTAPKISNIKISDVKSFSATITFDADEDSVGFVTYGKDENVLGSTGGASVYGKNQAIRLTGLSMGTDYFYKVKAVDKGGNTTTSEVGTFKTEFFTESLLNIDDAEAFQEEVEAAIESALPSLVPPFIEKPQATEITDSSVKITWRTNLNTYSVVSYATEEEFNNASDKTKPYVTEVSNTSEKVKDHEIIITNLNPNTRYHYMVKSFSLPRLVGQSSDLSFVTKALNIQAQINNITNSSFAVAWKTTDATSSVVEYRNTKTGVLNQKAIDELATSHQITVDSLTPATTYEVSVYGINAKGNKVQTATAVKITTSQDTKAPEILSLKIDTAIVPGRNDRTQTIISWKTTEPSNSIVYYEEGAGTVGGEQKELANKVEITNSYVLDHAVVISVLKPGGLYRIQVGSTDTAGNTTTIPVKTIVVPRQSESILDVVFKNFEDTFKFLREIGK